MVLLVKRPQWQDSTHEESSQVAIGPRLVLHVYKSEVSDDYLAHAEGMILGKRLKQKTFAAAKHEALRLLKDRLRETLEDVGLI